MNVTALADIPSWQWPEDAGQMFLDILRGDQAAAAERLLAAELAGNVTVINDELVDTLLSILSRRDEAETLRGIAAVALGPVLEYTDTHGFEDADDSPIAERTFHRIQQSLRALYMDGGVPTNVRRQILEASVRAPQDWHQAAVRAAYATDDESWMLTAVFCMGSVRGFAQQILEALDSENPEIHRAAVCAAGTWGMDAAWPHIAALIASGKTDKPLLLAAIDAVASIRPREAAEVLGVLTDSDDEDIVDAVFEATTMVEGLAGDEDDELRP